MTANDHDKLLAHKKQGYPLETPIYSSKRPIYYIGLVLVSLSLIFGLTTYLILTGLTPIPPKHLVVVTVLLINTFLIASMVLLIAWHIYELWKNTRSGKAGAKLHVRFVSQFSVVAALPAILLAIFASISLNRGLDHLFSTHTKTLVADSLEVANAYIKERSDLIRADVLAVASDVEKQLPKINRRSRKTRDKKIQKMLQFQSALRALPSLYLVQQDGRLIAKGGSAPDAYHKPKAGSIGASHDGTVIIIPPNRTNKIAAIKKLSHLSNTYLYALRPVNSKVLRHLHQARENVKKYQKLEEGRSGVEIAFALTYVAIALTLLLAAIWLGLWFANRLVEPIRQLIGAAERISKGKLNTSVQLGPHHGELALLGTTFNDMSSKLNSQRTELLNANHELDERHRFIEAVLYGVSAGVIGLDDFGIVTHINRSAEQMLGRTADELIEKHLEQIVPEFSPAIAMAKESENGEDTLIQDDIDMTVNGVERYFAVRLTWESRREHEYGFVLTFDDTTELVSAQRSSAWADVAQRIAHEMKNPLTPIQLSAERILKKYGPLLGDEQKTLEGLTNTIIRRVAEIERMVKEFSDYGRLPEPVMMLYDIRDIVSEIVTLYEYGQDNIKLDISVPDSPIISECDRGLLSQALINLVKNAAEAIISVREQKKSLLKTYEGHIEISLKGEEDEYKITVTDNGCGLPKEQRNRLLEPYMTTREKGTGLGLAIVQKTTEQHGGRIVLEDAPITQKRKSGASISLVIPYKKKQRSKVKPPVTGHVVTKNISNNNYNSEMNPQDEGDKRRV